MNTVIALFRGINVGGKNKIKMNELISILERLGYESVQTYIQSGNVVFQTNKAAREKEAAEISTAVYHEKGFEPRVLLLSAEEMKSAIANNPYPTENGKLLHFYFLEDQPTNPNLDRLNSLKKDREAFKLQDKVFYLYAPDGIGRSKLATAVEKALGVPATARNWNTVDKISEMVKGLET